MSMLEFLLNSETRWDNNKSKLAFHLYKNTSSKKSVCQVHCGNNALSEV